MKPQVQTSFGPERLLLCKPHRLYMKESEGPEHELCLFGGLGSLQLTVNWFLWWWRSTRCEQTSHRLTVLRGCWSLTQVLIMNSLRPNLTWKCLKCFENMLHETPFNRIFLFNVCVCVVLKKLYSKHGKWFIVWYGFLEIRLADISAFFLTCVMFLNVSSWCCSTSNTNSSSSPHLWEDIPRPQNKSLLPKHATPIPSKVGPTWQHLHVGPKASPPHVCQRGLTPGRESAAPPPTRDPQQHKIPVINMLIILSVDTLNYAASETVK